MKSYYESSSPTSNLVGEMIRQLDFGIFGSATKTKCHYNLRNVAKLSPPTASIKFHTFSELPRLTGTWLIDL